jgi:hypothetical protein
MTPYPDGPLILRGRFVITAPDGQPVPAGRRTVALTERGSECTTVAGSLARDSWTPGPETRRASSDFWMSGRPRDRRPASAEALPTLVRVASLNLMPELLPLSADGHKRPPACG